MGFVDNGISGFLFGIVVTVFLLRSVIFRKNQHSADFGYMFLILINMMWIFSILEIANSIWEVMYERGDYSLFLVSPTVNGFVIGVILHFFVFYKNKKYSGEV
jgi:hypothetical protein